MNVLIVHNSDEVIAAFGGTDEEIFQKIKDSHFWSDIVKRMAELEDDEGEPLMEEAINLQSFVNELYHDGDSQNGYTLLPLQ